MLASAVGIAGRYKLEVYRKGILIEQTPWFDNLITDEGLDYIGGSYSTVARCVVGTGNTTPTYADRTLVNQVAVSNSHVRVGGAVEHFVNTSNPDLYYTYSIVRYGFAIGAVVGSIAEVGIGQNDPLFSRSLIKDEAGNPSTLTLTAADQLFVLYEHRLYTPTADTAISFEANGVTQTGTRRIALWNKNLGWAVRTPPTRISPSISRAYGYYGSSGLGAMTDEPSGTRRNATGGSLVVTPYVKTSHQIDACCYVPGSGTLNAIMVGPYSGLLYDGAMYQAAWQFFFSPGIQKTEAQTLQMCWRMQWARYEA
jgi:hypothetical protein